MVDMNEFIVLGGGCFWCTEALFRELKGVVSAIPGYAGGVLRNPSYYDVSEGTSGHAEVIQIEFDPTIIPLEDLLTIFWHTHNPTTLNRQENDVGTQYRSAIFYTSEAQRKTADQLKEKLNASGEFESPVITEITKLDVFYPAEEYHKNYYSKNSDQPYCEFVISPKLQKLRRLYSSKIKG
jgi:methionine-S-sulfoxide reductase